MTIDHDAIAARVRNFLTTGQIFGIREVMSAYLDLYDEVKRLRAERDRFETALGRACQVGGTTYLVERAEKAEADLRHVIDERDATFALMLARAEKAEAELERLLFWRDQINIARQALKGQTND